jgi:hypothetical protein
MPTLVFKRSQVMTDRKIGFYRDFYTILQTHIGPDYAFYDSLIGLVRPGIKRGGV